jgi:hypothetical protein
MDEEQSGCCSCGSGCCGPAPEKRPIVIDFLYLDLSVCERCQGTETNLEEAVREVAGVLEAAGFDIVLNKINVTTKALAIQHKFLSSPTIRVNGKDIAMEFKETSCRECGGLCGDDVECRVWIYEGQEYNEPPKALIINAILKEVYGGGSPGPASTEPYELPKNLETFFDGCKGSKGI